MSVVGRATIALAIVALLAVNAIACRRYCAVEACQQSRWPYLTNDHTLHYANGIATRTYLRESASNAGYDPFFMAGYVKSAIWPSNSLLELVTFATPRLEPAQVFKTYVWFSAAAIPFALVYAGWRFGASPLTTFLAILFWIAQYWSGAPYQTFHYVQFGMAAFVWSVALTLAAGASLQHWLRTRSWAATTEMGLTAGLALMAHATAAVVLGVPALVAFFAHPEFQSRRTVVQAVVAVLLVLAVNVWWLAPLYLLRDAWGPSPLFFKNPNVLERLHDLFRVGDPALEAWAPPLMGVLAVFALLARRRFGVTPPLVIVWLFLLAFPGGLVESLTFLQLGRNTLHLNAWLCLPAAAVAVAALRQWKTVRGAVGAALLVWCGIGNAPLVDRNIENVFAGKLPATLARPFPQHLALYEALRKHAGGARRLLFEAFEDRNVELASGANPYGSVRLAPLIPMETGLEVIGGPYLSTHYLTNFANCGDGMFVGGRPWNRRDAESYFQIYALDLAALWSTPALAFAKRNPDLLTPIENVGGVQLYRITRAKAEWESAGLAVAATYNRITVQNPEGARGRFVLPYHAASGWSAEPACKVRSTRQGDDPVPFLTVVDPPKRVTLHFSPWALSGPPAQ